MSKRAGGTTTMSEQEPEPDDRVDRKAQPDPTKNFRPVPAVQSLGNFLAALTLYKFVQRQYNIEWDGWLTVDQKIYIFIIIIYLLYFPLSL